MVLAATTVALQGVTLPISGVLTSAMTLATRVASVAFLLPLEVGQGVILRPEEAFALSFPVPFDKLNVPTEAADGFPHESPPRPPCSAVHEEHVLGCLCITHVTDSKVGNLLLTTVR